MQIESSKASITLTGGTKEIATLQNILESAETSWFHVMFDQLTAAAEHQDDEHKMVYFLNRLKGTIADLVTPITHREKNKLLAGYFEWQKAGKWKPCESNVHHYGNTIGLTEEQVKYIISCI